MKNSLLLFFVLFVGLSFARKEDLVEPFKIVKDEFDASIPEGYYVLQGTVLTYPGKKAMYGVKVEGGKQELLTGKTGKFEIRLKLEEDEVEFSKTGYHSSYFENYGIRGRHRITIKANMEKLSEKYLRPAEKPVVYLYSDKDMEISVHLDAKGELHFSYPPLPEDHTWKMKLADNKLTDQKGQEYPYLFWDSKMKDLHVEYAPSGFRGEILAKKDVLPYLENQLNLLGLNATEKTDFITYWGPRLAEKNYVFIQFQVQQACDQFAEYAIEPKPDNVNRVYILFAGSDTYPEGIYVDPQELKPFVRTGFNVLEWGGVELDHLPFYEVRHD